MFTGIVQQVATVVQGGSRLSIRNAFSDLQLGESIAVNGVCLTVVSFGDQMDFDLSSETLSRTTLGNLKSGDKVNLERAMQLGDRLGGHIVLGHVDGVAELVSVDQDENGWILRVRVDEPKFLADKGSITLDGVSLTVVEPQDHEFKVAIVPHTWANTTLGNCAAGDQMNVEYDILAKHVLQLLRFKT